MYGMMSMILRYSSLIEPYTLKKTTIETIETIASGHQLPVHVSRCIDLSMYRYTPNWYSHLCTKYMYNVQTS